jgi:EmrB/QacA subfamily drug resistance transporter
VERRTAYILLAVLGTGVFLAGLELMITSVALPRIVADVADWTQLRKASWIINAYLLVYIATMPLAGRLADVWGARRLFLGALVLFTLGSLLSGMAQSLDQLIAGRVVQAVGGGALVPVATAAASHLFDGSSRPRAIGVIGGLTFLGMAAGPFVGAFVLETVRLETPLIHLGVVHGILPDLLTPAWRWVFYVNVPIGIAALAIAWAASAGWETPRHGRHVDAVGAVLFTVAVGSALIGVTLIGSQQGADGPSPLAVSGVLFVVAAVTGVLAIVRGLRAPEPFIDPRLFRDRVFSSAALVSLLTGYAFATAIVGGAIFVDRVLYGGPDVQRAALGSIALATAIGALASGFGVRFIGLRVVTLVGLLASTVALLLMSRWTSSVSITEVAILMGLYGLGFGLTVTPRSTAAVEAAGRARYGVASATVTVARMIGMAIGLAVLTAYGSTRIDSLSAQIYGTPDGYKAVVPPDLASRPLQDPLVVQALEAWAAAQAAGTMVVLFLVAGVVTVIAIPPGLALAARPRMLRDGARDESEAAGAGSGGGDGTDGAGAEPVAL